MDSSPIEIKPRQVAALVITVVIVVLLATCGMRSFVQVKSGHVGIKRTFKAVNPEPLREGLHFMIPFAQDIKQVSVRMVSETANSGASSKDLQNVTTVVTLQFSLSASFAPKTFQTIGKVEDVKHVLISPAIQESVKAVTARYTAEELITKREEVKNAVRDSVSNFIKQTLSEKKLQGAIIVANMAITDFRFSADFEQSIEAKVKAEQEALKALNEKRKRITEAEALAQEMKLTAEAEAYKTTIEAEAKAKAIDAEGESLKRNPKLIDMRAVERWDGVLPRIMTGEGGVLPFLNLSEESSAGPGR